MRKGHKWLSFICMALLLSICSSQLDLTSLTLDTYTASASATYTLSFFRISTFALPTDSKLLITFNPAYVGLITPLCSSPSLGTLSCYFLAKNLIIDLFTNFYLNIKTFNIVIAGITNPTPAKDYVPASYFSITTTTGTVDEGTSEISISITPLAALCSISILNPLVFQRRDLTIHYNSSYISGSSNSSYFLNVAIPTSYQGDSTNTLINPTFLSTVVATQPSSSQYIYSLEYTTTFTVTLLLPPSNKTQSNIITLSSYDTSRQGTLDSCSISLANIPPNSFSQVNISNATLQTYSNITFSLKLITPLSLKDQLQLNFSSAFDLSKITATSLAVSGYNNSTLSKKGNLLVITANLTKPEFGALLIFTLPLLGLPFTATAQPISISLIAQGNYYRASQTIAYSATAGQLALKINCLTLQVGSSTSCLFAVTTSNSLSSNMSVQLALPNDFPVGTANVSCAINGKGLNSVATCIYNAVTNTITAVSLNSTGNTLSPFNFTLNVSVIISQKVGNYQITATTLSAGQIVDTGSMSLTTVQRTLKSSELSIICMTSTTDTPTNYSINLAAPFDLGYVYTLKIYVPVDTQSGLQPTLTNAAVQSYQNQTFTATSSNLLNANYLIQNLKSPISTRPITITLALSYDGLVQFTGTQSIAMTSLKSIATLNVSQSNQVVYKAYIATFTVSGLAVADYIRITAGYSPFYADDQSSCSVTVASCLAAGIVKVNQITSNITVFNVSLINQPFVGTYSLTLTVYDSLNVYGKQAGSYSLASTITNSINVSASQTNPYLKQSSTYTFNLSFSTPNASLLYCLASQFSVASVQCNLNCGTPYFLAGYYIFSLSSTWVVIQFAVTNPEQFNTSTKFTFRTALGTADKDYGQHQPQAVCAANCRSCVTPNSALCSGCYSWSSLPFLYNSSCVNICPMGTFVSSGVCLSCSNVCTVCQGSSKNCSKCISGYYLSNMNCVSSCPSNSYLDAAALYCVGCTAPCDSCTANASNCTSCLLNYNNSDYFYLAGQCYPQCPITYYASLTNNSCYSCPSSCYSCNASFCLSCPANSYLYNGACYVSCPSGTYTLNSSHCSACVAPCNRCSSSWLCTSCVESYSLYNGSCLSSCPSYYYSSSNLCQQCAPPCLLCNATGCITCLNKSYYMNGQSCLSNCSAPLHPNNHSMLCEPCLSPCKDCTWTDFCLSCLSDYSFFSNTCISACPIAYYSDTAAICQPCPATCASCSLLNQRPFCSTCVNGTLVYSWDCVYECPVNSTVSGSYCVSLNCSELQGCLSCSGYRCLQCNSLYLLNSNYSCSYNLDSSAVLSALSRIPVPFPFLIGTLVLIILGFLLKHNYPKMFAPLFIYSLGGVLQQLCLGLWTVLALLWNANVAYPLPLVSVVYGTALVMIGYGLMNVVQGVLWRVRIAGDRKYRQWELQDNRCASVALWLLALLLSFRLDTLKYSRTAHSQRMSAKLSSADKFVHYKVLAILGLLINAGSILVAAYISYLQSSMNYLFFSCLEVAILSVLMIVFAIALLCVPPEQLLELKSDYKLGADQAQLQGTSLQEVLSGIAIVEEEHDFNREIISENGSAVAKQLHSHNYSGHSSEKLTDQNEAGFKQQDGQEARPQRDYSKGSEEIIFEGESQVHSSHVLLDQIQTNQDQAFTANKLYQLAQTSPQVLYHKTLPGLTSNPQLLTLPKMRSDSSVSGDFQQFQIAYQNNSWQFHRHAENRERGSTQQEQRIDELQIMRTIAQRVLEEEKVWEQHDIGLAEEGKEFDDLVGEVLIEYQEPNQEIAQREKQKKHEEEERKRRYEERIKQQKLQEVEEQRKNKKKEEAKRIQAQKIKEQQAEKELQRFLQLQNNCQLIEQQHRAQAQKLLQLETQQTYLQQKLNLQQRESIQRSLMDLEDRLSRASQIAQALKQKVGGVRRGSKKIAKRSARSKVSQNANEVEHQNFEYRNSDEVNLPTEYCPKKIKVNPRPLSPMFRKRHIFQYKNYEISQQSEQEQYPTNETQGEKQKKINQNTAYIAQDESETRSKVVHYQHHQSSRLQQLQPPKTQHHQPSKAQSHQRVQQKNVSSAAEGKQINSDAHAQQKQMERALGRIKYSQQEKVLQLQNQSDQSESNEGKAAQLSPTEHNPLQNQPKDAIPGQKITWKDEQFALQQSEITVYKHEIIKLQSSEKPLSEYSNSDLWPAQPQLEQRIDQIHRKADHYISLPKQPDLPSRNAQFISSVTPASYQECQEDAQTENKTIPEVLFEDCAGPTSGRTTKTRIRTGRVNRRVIDLSPQ